MHLSVKDCESYYCSQLQHGGNANYYHGINQQRGYGIFSGIARYLTPLVFAAGKYLGRKSLKTGSSVFSDVAGGRSFKESAKSRLRETGDNIQSDFVRKLQTGSGIKRKRSKQCHQNKKKRQKTTKRKKKAQHSKSASRDIFSF